MSSPERRDNVVRRLRIKLGLPDEPERLKLHEAIEHLKTGVLCVVRTTQLQELLDRLDRVEAELATGHRDIASGASGGEQVKLFDHEPEYE